MNCIIVDDEPIARQGMASLVIKSPDLNLKASFKNIEETQHYLASNQADLIFLDVQMPGVNGLDFARSLSKNTLVIFTTAFAQYALGSYEVDAVDYLVKPIHEDRFFKAVAKAKQFHYLLSDQVVKSKYESNGGGILMVRADRKLYRLMHKDILYLEGLKDYVIINMAAERLVTAMNLKTAQFKLPPGIFKRISKSFLININHVTAVGNHVVYIGNQEFPLGNVYREEFIKDYSEP